MSSKDLGACFVFTWKIENFLNLLKEEKFLHSPTFIVKSLKNTKWCLQCYESEMGYCGFYLMRDSSKEEIEVVTFQFEIDLQNDNGVSLSKRKSIPGRAFAISQDWGWIQFVEIKKIERLPNHTATLLCTIWNDSDEFQSPGVCHSETFLEKKRGVFTWCLKDFSILRPENRKSIEIRFPGSSVAFIPTSTLSLYLDGKRADENFKLEAIQCDTDLRNIFSFKMSATGSGEKLIDFAKGERVFDIDDGPQVASFQSLVSKQGVLAEKDLYLSSIGLVLQCEVTICFGKPISSIEYVSMNPPILELGPYINHKLAECPRKNDLHSLFEDAKEFLTDVTVRAGGETFHAHKILLSARSPAFRAIFASGMIGTTSKSLEIPEFCEYIYTDTIDDLHWDSASQLYQIAAKYQVLSLKRKCSVFLTNQITPSNACDLLVLADLHLDDYLKTFVLDFISDNRQDVMRMEEWKNLEENNVLLVCDTWKYVCHKNSAKIYNLF